MARRIESVMVSAYMMTRPLTLRAARPMVWISDVSERRKPSLSASRMATKRHLGQVQPFPQQVDADEDVELAQAQVPQNLHPLQRCRCRSAGSAPCMPMSRQVVGQILGHPLRERRHQHPLAPGDDAARISSIKSSIWPSTGRTTTSGSTSPVGRMICSTTAPALLQLVRPGRGRDEDHLVQLLPRTRQSQRPVVQRRRQAEAVLDQRLLAGAVAVVHRPAPAESSACDSSMIMR